MNLLTALAGADLRQIHSRSFRAPMVPAAASPTVAASPLAWLQTRFAQWRNAAALRRELESLGDTALADLGLSRSGLPAHVRQVMAKRRRAPRAQSANHLSPHLLQDLAVQLRQGRARVYTDVPLGVITRSPAAGDAANVQRWRRTA